MGYAREPSSFQRKKYLAWNALSDIRDDLLDRYINLQESMKILNLQDRLALFREIGGTQISRKNYRSLNINELKTLDASPLITIGVHTKNHYSLGRIDYLTTLKEINSCVHDIRKINKSKHLPFAYPFGGSSDCRNDLNDVFQYEGIDAVFLNQFGICTNETNIFEIPRILVRNLNGNQFKDFVEDL